MPKYKVMMMSDGEDDEMPMEDGSYDDAVFDTEEEANEAGLEAVGNSRLGAEILFMSNPGDYPYDEDTYDVDFRIIEIED